MVPRCRASGSPACAPLWVASAWTRPVALGWWLRVESGTSSETFDRDDPGYFRLRALQYANEVVDGDILACLYVRLACQRFLDDLDRDDITLGADGWVDRDHPAERWCRFLERLPHVKGKWAATGQSFALASWQIFVTVNAYGWHRVSDGLRRFREVYVEVPRKNGKSFMGAGYGLGHLCIDDEYGAEVYCGATSEKQAWEIFRPARQMCQREPDLVEAYNVQVNAKTLARLDNGSRFEPVIGKPGDGASPSCGIADEFHEHATPDLVETFQTGMGARDQPMMLYITTAGDDMGGPCYEKRADVINILKGTVEDDRIFGIVYTIDEKDEEAGIEGDEWDTLEAAKKANPNFGVSVSADFIEGQLDAARRSATKQTSYKTKHLNLWVGAMAAWLNMLRYQAARKKSLKIDDFEGEECIVSVDLASKVDIACMLAMFMREGRLSMFCRHYCPEARIEAAGLDRYQGWHKSGWLTATPGEVIDFDYIENDLKEWGSKFELLEVAYDPFQATQFATRMLDAGFPMVEFGATVKNFSEPMKQLEADFLTGSVDVEMDPVLMWMFGNVVARVDAKDNIFPRKERDESKIDGAVAAIMARARWMFHDEQATSLPANYEVGL